MLDHPIRASDAHPVVPAPPRIWALLGHRTGDNGQVLALAEALGLPFTEKRVRVAGRRFRPTAWTRPGLAQLDDASRNLLEPPWPDLLILSGRRFVPAARWIRARSGGRTRIVAIGRPRCPPAWLDLVLTTPNYGVPAAPNVLCLPMPLSRMTPARLADAATRDPAGLARFPAPRLVLLLGGDSAPFRLRPDDARAALGALAERAAERGGSVLAIGSRRTPEPVLAAVRDAAPRLGVPAALLEGTGEASPYAALLALSAEISVTADSAAMVADALATGRPVSLVPVTAARFGGALLGAMRRLRRAAEGEAVGLPAPLVAMARWLGRRALPGWPRDLWFLWRELGRRGLVGPLNDPGTVPVPDNRAIAAERVRALLAPGGREEALSRPPAGDRRTAPVRP